jgi:AAA15 family ATPase/GTPase
MIQEFKIENFKGFKNLAVSNIARINLIGGKNNVGKTSLLESIFTFYDRYNPDIFIKNAMQRGMTSFSINEDSQIEYWLASFRNFTNENKIILTSKEYSNKNEIVRIQIDDSYKVPLNPNELAGFDKGIVSSTTQNKLKNALHVVATINLKQVQDTYVYFLNNNLQMYAKILEMSNRKIVTFLSCKTTNPQSETVNFAELIKDGRDQKIIEVLRKIEPRIKSIIPIPTSDNQSILHADIGLARKIPLNYLGDGMFRLLSYLTAIIKNPKGIVLIDEIENGLHFSGHELIWQVLFEFAVENNVQIFANTHSLEMVKAFNSVALKMGSDKFMYFELFQESASDSIFINPIDTELLRFKLLNNKSFRGE